MIDKISKIQVVSVINAEILNAENQNRKLGWGIRSPEIIALKNILKIIKKL